MWGYSCTPTPAFFALLADTCFLKNGNSVLVGAAKNGNKDIVKVLIDAGVNKNSNDKVGSCSQSDHDVC